ncbi:hypothetical protein P3T40_000837 [Paraburkholderia sp. EB58]
MNFAYSNNTAGRQAPKSDTRGPRRGPPSAHFNHLSEIV